MRSHSPCSSSARSFAWRARVYRLAGARNGARGVATLTLSFSLATYALDKPAKGGDLLQLLIHRSLADISWLSGAVPLCNDSTRRERVLSLSLSHPPAIRLFHSRTDPRRCSQSLIGGKNRRKSDPIGDSLFLSFSFRTLDCPLLPPTNSTRPSRTHVRSFSRARALFPGYYYCF